LACARHLYYAYRDYDRARVQLAIARRSSPNDVDAIMLAWTNELDLGFERLGPLTTIPNGTYYGQLKLDPRWDPLRNDPRFDKLLAQLAPKD
jgi:hypothetical protein